MYTKTTRCAAAGLLTAMLHIAGASAAIVTDVASPALFDAPTAAESANINDLLFNAPLVDPGTIVNPVRSAPTNEINLGLDAPEPNAANEDAESLEMGVIRLPALSYSCPAATPVTITISQWNLTLLGASPSVTGNGAGGSLIMDARDRTLAAPATSATLGGSDNPGVIGQTSTMPARSFTGTFADLPHLTYVTAIPAAKVNTGTVYQTAYRATLPSLTLTYDNANCSVAGASSAVQAVPAMGFIHLLALMLLLPLITARYARSGS